MKARFHKDQLWLIRLKAPVTFGLQLNGLEGTGEVVGGGGLGGGGGVVTSSRTVNDLVVAGSPGSGVNFYLRHL